MFSIPSILNNSVFNSLPKFIAVPLLFFNVWNNKACRNSWLATSTARSLFDCSLFITIVCSPVSLFCNIKPCWPNAFLSTSLNLGSLDNSSACVLLSTVTTSSPSTSLARLVTVSTEIFKLFSALIWDNLLSISLTLSIAEDTKALFFPALDILESNLSFSLIRFIASCFKVPVIFKLLATLVAPWIFLKFVLIFSPCLIVILLCLTRLSTFWSTICAEPFLLAILTWVSNWRPLGAFVLNASAMFLYLPIANSLLIPIRVLKLFMLPTCAAKDNGPVTTSLPPIPSNKTSLKSFSWPAAFLPKYSPPIPVKASPAPATVVPNGADLINLLPALIPVPAILPPTPPVTAPRIPSNTPTVIPFLIALAFKSSTNSLLDKILFKFSVLKTGPSFQPPSGFSNMCSCINSPKVKPLTIIADWAVKPAVVAPPIAPTDDVMGANGPPTVPSAAPVAAPPPAANAVPPKTSSLWSELIWVEKLCAIIPSITLGLSINPSKKAADSDAPNSKALFLIVSNLRISLVDPTSCCALLASKKFFISSALA